MNKKSNTTEQQCNKQNVNGSNNRKCDHPEYHWDDVECLMICYFCGRSLTPHDESERIYRIKNNL